MEPVLADRPCVWIGWSGGVGHNRAVAQAAFDRMTLGTVRLSARDVADYYHGFCNASLWPLYHDAIQLPAFHRTWWDAYRTVNTRFAAAAAARAARGATVWIHDYHLHLVPAMLREKRPDLKIGFYLHIPFPPEELFAWLPWRAALLRGLLGADVVGFQTEASSRNFTRAAQRWCGSTGEHRLSSSNGHSTTVRTAPISIDSAAFETLARTDSVRLRAAELRRRFGGRKIVLSVDRLDYTKGIPQRLCAIEELLRDGRVRSSQAVFVQVAVPSREEAMGYREVRREVEEIVGRVNGEFSDPGHIAIHYFRRSLDREELAAYYLAADVMLVTPMRDGMNLVAKEYIACRHDLKGVLVLSEFAGASRELRRALLVNPRDIDGVKNVIVQALTMHESDRRIRMAILRAQVKRHDVHDWAERFLKEIS